LEELVLLLGLE